MRNYTRIRKLREIIKKESPDVLITFMGEPNFRGIIATMGTSTKNIISVRNDPNKEYAGRLNHFIAKHLLPIADWCVFQTRDAQKWFPVKLQKKSNIIINAVDPSFYEAHRKPKKNLIVSCGRLSNQKNQKLLIQAFNRIKERVPDAKLYIYGEGALENSLLELIDSYGLQKRILLKGQINNVKDALSEADLFVLSSDYEGMPNALMEAMAVGLPCISTDCPCGGPRELIEDGVNGMLVSVGDVESLSKAIVKVLEDVDLKEHLAIGAKEKALQFKPSKIFNEWEKCVNGIIKK
jgi:glycosyltransferase involved in cell wall biosynthesis